VFLIGLNLNIGFLDCLSTLAFILVYVCKAGEFGKTILLPNAWADGPLDYRSLFLSRAPILLSFTL